MPIQSLTIKNFRNLEEVHWKLAPGLNVLEGENAQGKTNLLEAVFYLANGRSFRTQHRESLIRKGTQGTFLGAQLLHGDLQSPLTMEIAMAGRTVRLVGKTLSSMKRIHELFRVLIFTPDSSLLFRSSPTQRRRYFDHAITVHNPAYGEWIQRYTRVLQQRNRLIEQGSPREALTAFDGQWAELTLEIMRERRAYLKTLLPFWKKRLASLTQTNAALAAEWQGQLNLEEHGAVAALLTALEEASAEERRYGRSLLGPHREDLWVGFGGELVREVGSQGQLRMLVIALKLAEADLFQTKTRHSPVFLLDDVGSELDPRHFERLLEMLTELHSQTILTSAQRGSFASLNARRFWVEMGLLHEGN